MKKFYLTKMFALLLLLCACKLMNGQSEIDGYALFNPKLGLYGSFKGGLPGYVYGNELNFLKNRFIIGLDYYHCRFTYVGSKTEKFNQFDLLFGRYVDCNSFRFQFQGGLGLFKGITYNESEEILTLGIPVKIGLKYLLSGSFSIGVDLQANLNLKYPVYMPMLSLELGRLKKEQ